MSEATPVSRAAFIRSSRCFFPMILMASGAPLMAQDDGATQHHTLFEAALPPIEETPVAASASHSLASSRCHHRRSLPGVPAVLMDA